MPSHVNLIKKKLDANINIPGIVRAFRNPIFSFFEFCSLYSESSDSVVDYSSVKSMFASFGDSIKKSMLKRPTVKTSPATMKKGVDKSSSVENF